MNIKLHNVILDIDIEEFVVANFDSVDCVLHLVKNFIFGWNTLNFILSFQQAVFDNLLILCDDNTVRVVSGNQSWFVVFTAFYQISSLIKDENILFCPYIDIIIDQLHVFYFIFKLFVDNFFLGWQIYFFELVAIRCYECSFAVVSNTYFNDLL